MSAQTTVRPSSSTAWSEMLCWRQDLGGLTVSLCPFPSFLWPDITQEQTLNLYCFLRLPFLMFKCSVARLHFGCCDSFITCKPLNNPELLSYTGLTIIEFKSNKSVNGVLLLAHTAETEAALCLTTLEYQRTTNLWKANRSILDRFTLCQLHPPAPSLSPAL